MAMQNGIITVPVFLFAVLMLLGTSFCLQYIVGDSIWSIPLTNNFYSNWSSSYTFRTGDALYFDFDSPFYNVIEVSRGEWESCTANQPYKAFMEGPATVPLMQKGVFYFICNVSNYCALGLKFSVTVEEKP
ncbi:unnamed protein product [Fraxinus pennsylvanica]|uniref:Phytocyanin domain-containing protein n=1 Tax=Fraxinus pennsylvanica TaxID=56036 RepID=A0AAD1ZNR9_9LAMI|nr:unnamed protein product [Fraxinus pennsylvanica]